MKRVFIALFFTLTLLCEGQMALGQGEVILTLTQEQVAELYNRFGSMWQQVGTDNGLESSVLSEFFGAGALRLRRVIRDENLPTADPEAMRLLQEIGADRKFVLYLGALSPLVTSTMTGTGKATGRRLARVFGKFASVEVEPNNTYQTQAEQATNLLPDDLPDDPLLERQYWLNNSRQVGNDINIIPVWRKYGQLLDPSYTGPRAPLYILDGGIFPHTELRCLDMGSSKSFMGRPQSDALEDRIPHGTHLGGIICAQSNNGIGIAGIAPSAIQIKSFKIAQGSWSGSGPSTQASLNDDGILEAMYWLLANTKDNQLVVVNASWGGFAYSPSLHDTIRANKRVVFVAAAGNNGGGQVHYPCALPEAICVAGLDQYGQLASFSNFDQQVGVLAFGETIVSLYPYNDYYTLRGTSQATPMVSATAALLVWRAAMLGVDLSRVSREMVIGAIKDGAKPITLNIARSEGEKEWVETRRLDVAGAMEAFEKALAKAGLVPPDAATRHAFFSPAPDGAGRATNEKR